MPIPRLAALTGLAVFGALCAGTAASVYTASIPSREAHASRAGNGATIGADPTDLALRNVAAAEAAERITYGACLQLREMLFGATGARWNALRELSAKLGADSTRARAQLAAFDKATLTKRVARCRTRG